MEIKVKENENIKETMITIECSQYNKEIEKIVHMLSHHRQTLICKKDKKIYQIYVQDIYYIEVVDEKTFVYVQNEFYETSYRLYELEILLKEYDFIRISKSCLLNLYYLQSVKVYIYGKYEATLVNNEKLIISRRYMSEFKRAFRL